MLALILFEAEDRAIMESSRVLRSFELLQLRRDRMVRSAQNVVELNQSLVISMPRFLEKLVILLKILNYGPTLHETLTHNVASHVPLSSDMLDHLCGKDTKSEWEHFSLLDHIARRTPLGSSVGNQRMHQVAAADDVADDEEVKELLLNAFSMGPAHREVEIDPLECILNVVRAAISIGVVVDQNAPGNAMVHQLLQLADMNPIRGPRSRGVDRYRNNRRRGAELYSTYMPADARYELQFHSMVLAPHQVEILFVMCTLLSGRRKIFVQNEYFSAGLSSAIQVMFKRLSWEAPPFLGPNPLEHIHGPDCECNPESALRVQFLRLVHNYFDRDFMNNPLKQDRVMVSEADCRALELGPDGGGSSADTGVEKTGLIGQLVATLVREPRDSVYQFWLCSCIECFLRGQPARFQVYFATAGLLRHLVEHSLNHSASMQAESLQTAFDLLGELVKYNQQTVEMLDLVLAGDSARGASVFTAPSTPGGSLIEEILNRVERSLPLQKMSDEFRKFIVMILDNMVDSNVFLRSLYLSLELISNECGSIVKSLQPERPARLPSFSRSAEYSNAFGTLNSDAAPFSAGYLTRSWMHFTPAVESKKELKAAASILSFPDQTIAATCASGLQGSPDDPKVAARSLKNNER